MIAARVLEKALRYSTHKLGKKAPHKFVLVNEKLLLEVESENVDNHVLKE